MVLEGELMYSMKVEDKEGIRVATLLEKGKPFQEFPCKVPNSTEYGFYVYQMQQVGMPAFALPNSIYEAVERFDAQKINKLKHQGFQQHIANNIRKAKEGNPTKLVLFEPQFIARHQWEDDDENMHTEKLTKLQKDAAQSLFLVQLAAGLKVIKLPEYNSSLEDFTENLKWAQEVLRRHNIELEKTEKGAECKMMVSINLREKLAVFTKKIELAEKAGALGISLRYASIRNPTVALNLTYLATQKKFAPLWFHVTNMVRRPHWKGTLELPARASCPMMVGLNTDSVALTVRRRFSNEDIPVELAEVLDEATCKYITLKEHEEEHGEGAELVSDLDFEPFSESSSLKETFIAYSERHCLNSVTKMQDHLAHTAALQQIAALKRRGKKELEAFVTDKGEALLAAKLFSE